LSAAWVPVASAANTRRARKRFTGG
jgi:hypothetical protein